MSMMKPDSIFKFGKHKGRSVLQVADTDPGYLCWMRRTGFSEFGKEVTEGIFAWEEANPEEVKRIDKSIEKKKLAEGIKTANTQVVPDAPTHDPLPPPQISLQSNLAWGSW